MIFRDSQLHRNLSVFRLAVLLAGPWSSLAIGQDAPTILTIDLDNFVEYRADTTDVSQYGINPGVTPPGAVLNSHTFWVATGLGDIVAVNGQPAKGLYVMRSRGIRTAPNPSPGGSIADVTRDAIREEVFEILSTSATSIGSIMSLGLSGGAPPPGAPTAQTGVNSPLLAERGRLSASGEYRVRREARHVERL